MRARAVLRPRCPMSRIARCQMVEDVLDVRNHACHDALRMLIGASVSWPVVSDQTDAALLRIPDPRLEEQARGGRAVVDDYGRPVRVPCLSHAEIATVSSSYVVFDHAALLPLVTGTLAVMVVEG